MNRGIVEDILEVIRTSTDKTVIFKGLVKLRTDVVKDSAGIVLFREAGGVMPMVVFLKKPHEQILEVALSILGNCCTDDESCRQALDCNVSVPLATILKSIPNPVIQCRACRLLGNLAKCNCAELLATHCPAIAHSVRQIIEETSDVYTRIMAFRACRFLLTNPQFVKHFFQANGFTTLLRLLAVVMKNDTPPEDQITVECPPPQPSAGLKKNQNQDREEYFKEVARHFEGVRSDIFDYEVLKNSSRASNAYAMPLEKLALDLLGEILKCLLVLSELQISAGVWESLRQNSGCSFAPIVYFVDEDNKHRSVALKILSNFSKNLAALYILSAADAIVAACELLVSPDMAVPLSESETRHCLNVIGMLSSDACNRSKIRRSGAIRKLIAMVRDSQSKSEITSIFHLLNNFQYDNMSMELMLNEGLIGGLVKQLNLYLDSDDDYHRKRREEKLQQMIRKRKRSPEHSLLATTIDEKCKQSKYPLDIESPSSSPKSDSWSLGGSFNKVDGAEPDCDEETYSPVCSDFDDDDDEDGNSEVMSTTANSTADSLNTLTADNSDIMKLLDIASRPNETNEDNLLDKEDDDDFGTDNLAFNLPQLVSGPRSTIDIIENLLFRVTLLINKRGELAKPETLSALLKALNTFGTKNNFSGSLTNILLESRFFAQVVKQGIVHQLYQLTKNEEMRKDGFAFLDTLTCVAESNYGREELARLLRSDDASMQNRAAIAVAYVIKNLRLLHQFLNDGNALNVLLSTVLNKEQVYDDSVKDDSPIFAHEGIDALTSMCRYTLQISLTVPERNEDATRYNDELFVEDCRQPLHANCDMRFVVHEKHESDSSVAVVVEFNKQLLCDASEVFRTMLNSDFREGKEGEIQLHTCTVTGLRYFLNLIAREAIGQPCNRPPALKFHALLEAFEMSRLYLLPDFERTLKALLMNMLDASNCLSIFEWSIKNHDTDLTDITINYYLSSELAPATKVELFRTADYSTFATEWFQMIIDTVLLHSKHF